MIREAIARHHFGLALLLLVAVQLLIVCAIFAFLALDMTNVQRAWLGEMLWQRLALGGALAVLLLFALAFGLRTLLEAYVTPVARLAEDAVLLAANPGHRITAQGARNVRILAEKLNLLAAVHQSLHDEVQEKIEVANRALAQERNRLAALMAELTMSVLVCNIDGRILLYNANARHLLESRDGGVFSPGGAAIGLGLTVRCVGTRANPACARTNPVSARAACRWHDATGIRLRHHARRRADRARPHVPCV